MKSITARVSTPMIPSGRVSVFKQVPKGTEGSVEGSCEHCGKVFWYIDCSDKNNEYICQLACSHECSQESGFYPVLSKYTVSPKTPDRPESCPDCGGSRSGRGYAHEDNCPVIQPNRKDRSPCPDCGGPPGKRRGWIHNDGCPKNPQNRKKSPPCPECGGPARGRGHIHSDSCMKNRKDKS